MPFRSESQRRKFWAMVNRGEISRGTAEEWEAATPPGKLPERVKTAFLDELQKMASEVKLNPSEKRHQALQFAGLGVTALPALALAQEKIRTGRWIPRGSNPKRFLGAAALGGLFWGGALPYLQHAIARTNLSKARARMSAEKEMQHLVPGGTRAVSHVVNKLPVETPGPGPGLPRLNHA